MRPGFSMAISQRFFYPLRDVLSGFSIDVVFSYLLILLSEQVDIFYTCRDQCTGSFLINLSNWAFKFLALLLVDADIFFALRLIKKGFFCVSQLFTKQGDDVQELFYLSEGIVA